MPALKKKTAPINLLPTDEGQGTIASRVITWLLGTFRFLVITVELVVIIGFLSRFFLDSQNADLSDEISQKKALIESYLPFEKEFKHTQERLVTLNTYAYSDTPFSNFMSQITKNISPDLSITQMSKNGNELTLVIVGTNEQSIVTLAARLRKEPLLNDLHVLSVEGMQNSNAIQATFRMGEKPVQDEE